MNRFSQELAGEKFYGYRLYNIRVTSEPLK